MAELAIALARLALAAAHLAADLTSDLLDEVDIHLDHLERGTQP